MSNLHAYADTCEPPAVAFDLANVAANVARLARSSIAVTSRLWPRDLTRYPDHLLADMGFERDWDGTVIRAARD